MPGFRRATLIRLDRRVDRLKRRFPQCLAAFASSELFSGPSHHHAFPKLMPPIDREYTLSFFFGNTLVDTHEEAAFRRSSHPFAISRVPRKQPSGNAYNARVGAPAKGVPGRTVHRGVPENPLNSASRFGGVARRGCPAERIRRAVAGGEAQVAEAL